MASCVQLSASYTHPHLELDSVMEEEEDEVDGAVETFDGEIEKMTVNLTVDAVHMMLDRSSTGCSHSKTMRRVVKDVSEKHQIMFKSMVQKMKLDSPKSAMRALQNIIDDLFKGDEYNWGRVVAAIAFIGCLTRHLVHEKVLNVEQVDLPATEMGKQLARRLAPWIRSQGSWESFETLYAEKTDFLWKGLLCTSVVLGTMAAVVAAR